MSEISSVAKGSDSHPSGSSEEAGLLLAQVTVARAAQLARAGRFDEARQLLDGCGDSVAALDLLARVAAQQGQLDHAREHWRKVARLCPEHAGAAAGLAWLDGGGRAGGRRWVAVALFFLGLAVGSGLVAGVARGPAGASREQLREEMHRLEARLEQRLAVLAVPSPAAPPEKARPAPPALPEELRRGLQGDGLEVRADGDGFLVLFPERVFRRATVPMPGMADRLSALGSRLLPYAADLRIEVIGSADAAPVKEGERFRDNGDLALARAVAAGRWLTHSARMPPAALTFHVRLPLTADLDALDRKNRTVALHLGAVDTR